VLSQVQIGSFRSFLVRMVVLLAAFTMASEAFVTEVTAASVPRKYAAIVIDAKSGKVLYESSADAARYPASVTKVMTLYVLFQELAAGNITLGTKFKVSKYAAAATPTKLGLRAGSTITVENCIKALVTISANDMARVIAENISGSEAAFAKRMTATARALGMTHTTYRNASGLPDPGQVTTVRDQAKLGMAIFEHFPKYYSYFQTRSFSYGKRTYGNHNRLLGSNGVDGIKTGYTNASGFNLLTAARSNGRHIVVAGFGFDSSGARDAKIRELVKAYLPKGRSGQYLASASIPEPGRKGSTVLVASNDPRPVMPMPYPSFRRAAVVETVAAAPSVGTDEIEVASVAAAPMPAKRPVDQPASAAAAVTAAVIQPMSDQDRPLDVIGAWISDNFSLGAAPAPLGQTRPSAPLVPPAGIDETTGAPLDLLTSGSTERVAEVPAPSQALPPELAGGNNKPTSGWIVQIGAAPSENGANSLISDASARIGNLTGLRPYIEKFEKNGQVFYRARFGGFDDRDAATNLCSELKKAKMSCLAMQS